jgi:TolB protein
LSTFTMKLPGIILIFILLIVLSLVMLLAAWIFRLLARSGAFGRNPWILRVGSLAFLLAPLLASAILVPRILSHRPTPRLMPDLAGQKFSATSLPTASGSYQPPEPAQEPAGKIVYTCQVFGDQNRDQICIMNADGSEQRRLTTNDRGDYNFASLSPDGSQVIYTGNESGLYELFQMDLESGAVTQLTHDQGDLTGPAVSPDESTIVYNSKAGGHESIWLMDRSGGSQHQIFGQPQGEGWDPSWSPDGRYILFASNQSGDIQLYRMRVDGQELQQVSHMAGIRGRNDWSSDNQTIATYAGEAWGREIFLMDLQGENVRQITHGGNNLAPGFSPDGGWITFTSYRDRFRDENGCEIYIMHLDGSDIRRLTDNKTCDWQPRWGR